jgi:uncharacterized protein YcgL (UPF0745 family)
VYLYLDERDDFSKVPDALMSVFGAPEFALEFELSMTRKLAKEDPVEVMRNLESRGFHLQMPPQNEQPI